MTAKGFGKGLLAVVITVAITQLLLLLGMRLAIPTVFGVLLALQAQSLAPFIAASIIELATELCVYPHYDVTLTAAGILAAFVTVTLLRRKIAYRIAVAVASAILGVSVYLYFAVPSVVSGNSPFDGLKTLLSELSAEADLGVEWLSSGALAAGITAGALAWGCYTVLLVKALSELIGKRKLFKPMAPFHMWFLSKRFTVGMITCGICAIIAVSLFPEKVEATVYATATAFTLPLVVQGITFVTFLSATGCLMSWMRIVPVLLLLFVTPVGLLICLSLGLLDQFTRLRTHVRMIPKK